MVALFLLGRLRTSSPARPIMAEPHFDRGTPGYQAPTRPNGGSRPYFWAKFIILYIGVLGYVLGRETEARIYLRHFYKHLEGTTLGRRIGDRSFPGLIGAW